MMSAPGANLVESSMQVLATRPDSLAGLHRGIEKESLRVATDGSLSRRPHPSALGSPLTHPHITTDFSESQLELITGVHTSPAACLAELELIHRHVFDNIDNELLWPSSMPCLVGADHEIPIGAYGSSNIGLAKTVYRRGLGLRYGRLMQTISGIHYNFSLPETLWETLGVTSQQQRTAAYFGLIRNFRRWSWLLMYAFGASPAVCRSFTRNFTHIRDHGLQPFDEGSQHLPFATSLRMGPLGYQSSAQSALHISYNSLNEYASSMVQALTTEYPEYATHGLQRDGEYHQLSTTILQIENEFYGTIRPKRTIHPGERPVTALRARGVEYVEVRCLDLNPFLPLGIDTETIRFLDAFLLTCLLAASGPDSKAESRRMSGNQLAVVQQGRDPALTLKDEKNTPRQMREWAGALLDSCAQVASLLDAANNTRAYSDSVTARREAVNDPALTPSARVLQTMRDQAIPFFGFSMNRAEQIKADFDAMPPDAGQRADFRHSVEESLSRQQAMEAADTRSFDEFLVDYLALPA